MKYQTLIKKYPKFIYQSYSYKLVNNRLKIIFNFLIVGERNIYLSPEITIKNIDRNRLSKIDKKVLDNLIFNLGLIEMVSYWKATCSPKIEIQAGALDKKQINWLKDLMINGLGQFFYENQINFLKPNFFEIESRGNQKSAKNLYQKNLNNQVIVPIGNGKDSIVAWELLKSAKKKIVCFSLNPTQVTEKIIKVAGCKNPIIIERKIDKTLLELNRKGFLNGHTPFSAYLAFLSVLLAVLFNKKYIAFANERSADEGNIKYLGKIINHQYSKSFAFEKKFRGYSRQYLAKDAQYFSFLRPLFEIQIIKIFAKYPKYFKVFLSCNEAQKTTSGTRKPTNKWCGRCPKCLFVFIALSAFLDQKKVVKIFGKNLLQDKKLIPLLNQLIGQEKVKPFECIGTKKETLAALYLALKKTGFDNLPPLLKYFQNRILPKYPNLEKESKAIMNSWNSRQ